MLEENAARIVLADIKKISRAKIDRECTEKALKDTKLDYETVRDYNNDIIGDNRCIESATNNINSIFQNCSKDELVSLITDIYDLANSEFKQKTIEKNIK